MDADEKTWADWEVLVQEETDATFILFKRESDDDFGPVLSSSFIAKEDIIQEPNVQFEKILEFAYCLGYKFDEDFTHIAIIGKSPQIEHKLMHVYKITGELRSEIDRRLGFVDEDELEEVEDEELEEEEAEFDDYEFTFECRQVIDFETDEILTDYDA